MTQNGSVPAGEHRRKPFAPLADASMPEREDLAVQDEEAPCFDPSRDRARTQTEGQQLAP